MPYAANGQISTEPQDGWVEITDEQYQAALEGMMSGRLVVVDGGFAVIEPPEPEQLTPEQPAADTPPADTVPSLTFAQLLIGLVDRKWITEAEGEAWLSGTLPAAVLAVIATLPANQRFAAKARAARPSTVLRSDPLLIALAASQGKSQDQLDTFFAVYSQV